MKLKECLFIVTASIKQMSDCIRVYASGRCLSSLSTIKQKNVAPLTTYNKREKTK